MNTGDALSPPPGRPNANARRKQTLSALLDALQELQQDGQRDEESARSLLLLSIPSAHVLTPIITGEVSPQELERELARRTCYAFCTVFWKHSIDLSLTLAAAISDERLGAEAFDKLDTLVPCAPTKIPIR